MKRMFIEAYELAQMVKQKIIEEGHADELLYSSEPDIRVSIEEDGAHITMPNVKED